MVFCKKVALKNFAKFTEKHQRQSLFFNKLSGLNLQLYQKRLLYPANFEKFSEHLSHRKPRVAASDYCTYSFHKCSSPSHMRSIIYFIVNILPNSSFLHIVHTFGVLLFGSDWISYCFLNSDVVTFLGLILTSSELEFSALLTPKSDANMLTIVSGLILYIKVLDWSSFVINNEQFALLNASECLHPCRFILFYSMFFFLKYIGNEIWLLNQHKSDA